MLLEEVDTALHDAVAASDFGPGKSMTSTLEYVPQYFLIDGVSYTNGLQPIFVGRPGDRILLRLLNVGLDYRVPTLNNGYFTLLAEDGNPLSFPRETYSAMLSPLKTMTRCSQSRRPTRRRLSRSTTVASASSTRPPRRPAAC